VTKTAITEQWVENRDYQLIPKEEDDHWYIRIQKGTYVECVIRYLKVSFDEENMMLRFDYELVESTDPHFSSEDEELQKVASHILHSVLMSAFSDEQDKS